MENDKILSRVCNFIIEHQLIEPGDRIVVGLSGGPDSIALLHILLGLAGHFGCTVSAGHLNHGLREEADLDQRLAEDVCREWQVPLRVSLVDVAAKARQEKRSLEDAGRQARYEFLELLRVESGAHKIATAHHRGDQAETVLLHLIQGTGAGGLQGILPRRGLVIRPMLDLDKGEIIAYLNQYGIAYRTDYSNYDRSYLRNRIRWDLLPLLTRDFNPAIEKSLCRLAGIVRDENAFWDEMIHEAQQRVSLEGSNGTRLSVQELQNLPGALRRRLLLKLLQDAGGERVGWSDIDRTMALLDQGASGRRIPVSGGVWVEKSYGILEIVTELSPGTPFCYPLQIPGVLDVAETGWRIQTRLLYNPEQSMPGAVLLDRDRLPERLYIRSRRPGDHFQPIGMQGSKKLKDYFIDAKIPRRDRDQIPLLASENEVYALFPNRIDRRVQVGPDTIRYLELIAIRAAR